MNLETLLLILQILILLAVIALGYLAKSLSGYATEKGKNLATKEDIRVITEKVESVKYDFSIQLERLKADLNANIQQQLSIFGKRNEALTQFFEDSLTVLTLLRSPFHFRYEDVDGLDRMIKENQVSIVRAIASYYRLMIYVQEGHLFTTAIKAVTTLITLHKTWFNLATDFRNAFVIEAEEWELAINTNDNSYFAQNIEAKLSVQAVIKLRQGIDPTLNTLEESLKEYANALNVHFHSIDNSKALTATTET